MDIHLHAVKFAIEELELPLKPETKRYYPEMILRLQLCQNVISSIVEASSTIESEFVEDIRLVSLTRYHAVLLDSL